MINRIANNLKLRIERRSLLRKIDEAYLAIDQIDRNSDARARRSGEVWNTPEATNNARFKSDMTIDPRAAEWEKRVSEIDSILGGFKNEPGVSFKRPN